MPDMLVKLYALPPLEPALQRCADAGITIRPARAFERTALRRFVERHFNERWADEADTGFSRQPVSVHLATTGEHRAAEIVGFSAHECTARGFFGPTGVAESARGSGTGTALLLASLHAQRDLGYAYAIIGGVGPAAFYERACGATIIPGSETSVYGDLLKPS